MIENGLHIRTPPVRQDTPIVFIVVDDVSIREALEILVRNDGWQPVRILTKPACAGRSQRDPAGEVPLG